MTLMFYTYNPTSKENKPTMVWLSIVFLAVMWSSFEAPLSFVMSTNISTASIIIDCALSLFFFIDIGLHLKTKLKLPGQQLGEFDISETKNRPYHKSLWLPLDIITSLPFELIAISMGLGFPMRVIAGLRLLRVFRIIKLRNVLGVFDFLPKQLKIPVIITLIALAIHWIACGWMVINPHPELDTISFYNVSLYWAITTLTTVGYGDIAPVTNIGRLYTMGVMIIGVTSFGVIIGNFYRMFNLADKHKEDRKEKMSHIQQFMKHYNIPFNLQRQVFSFYNHVLDKNFSEQDNEIVKDLPKALQNELNIYMKIRLIRDVHIFKECSIPCLKMIAERLEQTYHSPNEYIVRKGDVGEEMFIIGHGDVEVSAGEKVLSELKSGQFFGEIALLEDTVRSADVKTTSYSDLYTFKKEDFKQITLKYPHLGEKIASRYKKRKSDADLLAQQQVA